MSVKYTMHRLQAYWTSTTTGKPRAKVIGVWLEKEPAIERMTAEMKKERSFPVSFRIVATTAELYRIEFGEVIDSPLKKDDIIEAVHAELALCVNCGEEHSGFEPDARQCKCQACEQYTVYGAEELLIRIA